MLGEDMWYMGIYDIVFIMFLLPWPSRRERRKTEGRREESGQSVPPEWGTPLSMLAVSVQNRSYSVPFFLLHLFINIVVIHINHKRAQGRLRMLTLGTDLCPIATTNSRAKSG